MEKRAFLSIILAIYIGLAWGQTPKKRLPQNINVPTYSHIFPSLSGDGNQMIYLTNYTNSEGFETKYTYKTGRETWADPEPIPSINKPGLDQIGSFCLSYDGNFVVFSSRRMPGIGNYDIWISEKIGKSWGRPHNPGKPLNSPGNEGNPCLSPDGKSIYFVRCEQMNVTSKSHCGIYVSHRLSPTRWSDPERLPDQINASHETTPRIMADNKTLIFASGRPGGKGKLDLYTSVLTGQTWSQPTPLDFINTAENDEFISIPARGDIIYFTAPYRDQNNIYKAIIPERYRPQKVLMLMGKVNYTDQANPADDVVLQAYDLATGQVYTTTRLRSSDGGFTLFLPEGTSYDVSAYPKKGGHLYSSRIIDLEQMSISKREEQNITLAAVQPGTILPLQTIRYENYTANLTHESDIELKRIIGFLKKNPGTRIEIGAYIDSVYTDSIPSADLTEIIADTSFITMEKEAFLSGISRDTLARSGDLPNTTDTTAQADTLADVGDDLPPVVKTSKIDSLRALGYTLLSEKADSTTFVKVRISYHNDRTPRLAEALMQKLIAKGVPADLLEARGYGDQWTQDRAVEERNYWIELKILP